MVYLVPLAADRVTPLIPQSLERRLGDAVDNQVRAIFGGKPCATSDGEAAVEYRLRFCRREFERSLLRLVDLFHSAWRAGRGVRLVL